MDSTERAGPSGTKRLREKETDFERAKVSKVAEGSLIARTEIVAAPTIAQGAAAKKQEETDSLLLPFFYTKTDSPLFTHQPEPILTHFNTLTLEEMQSIPSDKYFFLIVGQNLGFLLAFLNYIQILESQDKEKAAVFKELCKERIFIPHRRSILRHNYETILHQLFRSPRHEDTLPKLLLMFPQECLTCLRTRSAEQTPVLPIDYIGNYDRYRGPVVEQVTIWLINQLIEVIKIPDTTFSSESSTSSDAAALPGPKESDQKMSLSSTSTTRVIEWLSSDNPWEGRTEEELEKTIFPLLAPLLVGKTAQQSIKEHCTSLYPLYKTISEIAKKTESLQKAVLLISKPVESVQ